MKEFFKKIGRIVDRCLDVVGTPTAFLVVLLFACCLLFHLVLLNTIREMDLWKHMVTFPEPEHCALCADNRTVRRYPCLVKLATGEIGQIRVYDLGSEFLEGNNQFEETGFYTFAFFAADCFASNTTIAGTSTSSVPIHKDALYINPYLYCRDCRARIGNVLKTGSICITGYVIVDLYDLEDIRIYPIEEDAKYNVRDYTVEISKDKETKNLIVSVTGCFK